MTQKMLNSNRKMRKDMYTEKEHYKMYKSGDHWVTAKIATIAGVALFSTVILGGGMQGKVNADNVSSSMVSSVKATVQSSSTTSSSNSGIAVNVPHKDLDNAVDQAKKAGVEVTQGQTVQHTAKADQASQAEQQIKNDYQNQTSSINKATQQQEHVNSARQTAANHSSLDNAVDQAKKVGVQVTQGTTQTIKGEPTDASKVQSQVNGDYQNQVSSINKAAQQQEQNNQIEQKLNSDHSSIDNTVDQAKKVGVTVTQTNGKTVTGNADQVQSQINSDYNDEVQDLQNAIKKQTAFNQQYQTAMKQYNEALADYNKQKQAYDQAQKELHQSGVNTTGITSNSIQNVFNLQNEPDSVCSVSDDPNIDIIKCPIKIAKASNGQPFAYPDVSGISNLPPSLQWLKGFPTKLQGDQLQLPIHGETNWNSKYIYIFVPKDGGTTVNGQVATFTFTNLKNTTYDGQPVSKIVVDYTNMVGGQKGLDFSGAPNAQPTMWVASDFEEGMMLHGKSIDVAVHVYDAAGKEITTNSDAYMTFGSISHSSDHQEYIKALNGDKLLPVKGSSIPITDDGTVAEGDWGNSEVPGGQDDPHSPIFYGDSAVLQSAKDSNGFYFQFGANNKDDSAPKGQWVSPCTVIPTFPTDPGSVPPKAPTLQHASVNYHYDTAKIDPIQTSYHYDNVNIPNVKATYHEDGLNITPVETKGVDVDGQNVNGKDVIAGETLSFPLTSDPLPANRENDVKTLQITDTLNPDLKFDSWNAVDSQGNDVTKDFTLTQNGQNLTFNASQALMNEINANKGQAFNLPTIIINAIPTASGVDIHNTFDININGQKWTSNTVGVNTPATPKPQKDVDNAQGQSIDGHFVEDGQKDSFNLTFDLSNDKNVVLDKGVIAKGLGMSDQLDKNVTPDVKGIVITDAKGQVVNNNLFNITDNNNDITISVKDPQAFLNTYGGQKLNIKIPFTINQGFHGSIPNTAVENHFGDKVKTNQVIVYVPQPTKDVGAGTISGVIKASINGDKVVQGQNLTFTLNVPNLPAGRKETINKFTLTDVLDPNFDYTGFKAELGNKDVSKYFAPSLTKNSNGQWVLTLTATKAFVDTTNQNKGKEFIMPVIDIYGTALKGGVTIKNSFQEGINNDSWESNTVTVHSEKPGTPVKSVTNQDEQNADNGNVERGDTLNYHFTMDLGNIAKDTVLTPDEVKKGLGDIDHLPKGIKVDPSQVTVTDANGKNITNDFNITLTNGTLSVTAKDPASLVKEYGGTKLTINFTSTVEDGFTGDISNTVEQNTFGNITKSNTVVDHVVPMDPTKDVVVNLGNQASLNGKTISLGQTFDYKLNSSTRPADYVGQTNEWGGKDMIDIKHDEFTGQWQVIADHSFTLKDGTVIKAGTDITKYFTLTFNPKTGEIDVQANKDFLDIMNLPANKKTQQGWSLFFQCKRIASGTAHNTWVEYYNNQPQNSNTVTTNTPAPKKVTPKTPEVKGKVPESMPQKVTPTKNVPTAPTKTTSVQPKATPMQPMVAAATPKAMPSPVSKESALPQTGENTNDEATIIGLAALGTVGLLGLGLRKRRYE